MTVSQELLKRYLDQDTIWSCKIPSRSKKGVEYLIRFHKDGRITHEPNCKASQFNQECWHIRKARDIWKYEKEKLHKKNM